MPLPKRPSTPYLFATRSRGVPIVVWCALLFGDTFGNGNAPESCRPAPGETRLLTGLEVPWPTDLHWPEKPFPILLLTSSASSCSHPFSGSLFRGCARSRGGWCDGRTVTGEHKKRGKFLNALILSHPPWNRGIQLTFCPHQTQPLWHSWNAEAFFTNLGNYHSGHGAQNRDRDPGWCTVTAHVAEAVFRFVQLKLDLPTNSSLTSLRQPIFGCDNGGWLVYCVKIMDTKHSHGFYGKFVWCVLLPIVYTLGYVSHWMFVFFLSGLFN